MASQRGKRRPDTAGSQRGSSRGSNRRNRAAPAGTATGNAPPVVGFVSLGCAKNLVDSEKMLGQIAESGAVLTGDESAADTMVVNTCGFLGVARQEALEVLGELAERKRRGQLRRIVVAGCLVQRDDRALLESVPEIDALVGVNNRDDVAAAVWGRWPSRAGTPNRTGTDRPRLGAESPRRRADSGGRDVDLFLGDYHPAAAAAGWTDRGRLRLTPRHYAYVRIGEGCNQKCTFCTIPSIRGPLHSKPLTELVTECRELIADGAQELILIGQDTTSYGVDLGDARGLAGLLRALDAACDGARWLRLMYVYPSVFTDEMIDAIASCARVVKYIDIPLQHIHDRLLRAMGRHVTRAQTETLLEKLRARIPGVTIRTTFIVGFPGETEAEFAELVRFVREFGFDAVGSFTYSYEAETPAAKIAGHLDEAVKRARQERLMLAQQERAFAAARERVGQSFEVLVDGRGDDGAYLARHAGQAPDVDGVCRVRATDGLDPGSFVRVRCVDSDGYDLIGEPVGRGLPVVSTP